MIKSDQMIKVTKDEMCMYELVEISRDGASITAKMIPMKERRYFDENGCLVIEYYSEDKDQK